METNNIIPGGKKPMEGRKHLKKLISGLLFCLLTATANAGVGGSSGLGFLNLGIGARSVAMGGAFTGIANDVSAGYFNPGGLAQVSGTEALFMYDSWLEGMSHMYLGVGSKLKGGSVVGGFVNTLNAGTFDAYDTAGAALTSVSASDMSIGFSYATRLQSGLMVGGNLKTVQESLGSVSGSGFGIDLGLLSRGDGGVSYGLALQNLGASVKLRTETVAAPMVIRAGVGYNMADKGTPITVVGDISMVDGGMNIGLGGEYSAGSVAFRLGAANTNSGTAPSFGVGINSGQMLVDIGMSMNGDFGSAMKVSLIGKFGATESPAAGRNKRIRISPAKNNIDQQIKDAIAARDFKKASELKKKKEAMKSAQIAAPASAVSSAELIQLRQEMSKALAAEDYVKAAEIKQKIKELEAQQAAAPAVADNSAEIAKLKAELDQALADKNYTKAIELKKKIKELEGGSGPAIADNSAEIQKLKAELDQALADKDYSKAIELKKKIKELEGGSGPAIAVPAAAPAPVPVVDNSAEISRLKGELDQALADKNYSKAIEVKKKIKELESK